MSEDYRLLLVEDDEAHVALLKNWLQKIEMNIDISVVSFEHELIEILDNNPPDLIISDYILPDFTGLDVLKLTRERYPHLPFILFSGYIGQQIAVDAMLQGASDSVMKDHPERLIPAVKRELLNYKEQQRKEKKLKESESKYQALVQTVDGIVWEADANTFKFHYVSPQSKDILGYDPSQWYSEKGFWKNHIHPEDREEALKFCHHKSQEGENHTFEYRMITADNQIVWLRDYVTVLLKDGKPSLLRGVMVDITESKLFSELERLENTLLTMTTNRRGSLKDILRVFIKGIESLFPGMILSILKVENDRVYHWAVSERLPARYLEAINGQKIGPNTGSCGTAAYLNKKVVAADISTDPRWESYKEFALRDNLKACWSQPLIDKQKKVIGTFAVYYTEPREPTAFEEKIVARGKKILQVLIENKRSEQALKKKQKLLDEAYKLADIGHWELDVENSEVYWSSTIKQLFEVDKDYKPGLESSINFFKEGKSRKCMKEVIGNAIAHGELFDEELQIITAQDNAKWVRIVGEPVFKNGECLFIFGSTQDITERRQKESALREMLSEKETLLLEINHRVKNNLAVISGMMQLQAFEEESRELQKKLFDSVSRIQTMATIHELLYKSNSFSRITLGENIKILVSSIVKTHQFEQSIKVTYDIEEIELNINQAIPFSLIINEVITNALKHAFPHGNDGKIKIETSVRENVIHLNIKDDGKGLPVDFNPPQESSSLGITLIKTLSNQLKGSCEYQPTEGGTVFKLVFKKTDTKGSSSTFLNK